MDEKNILEIDKHAKEYTFRYFGVVSIGVPCSELQKIQAFTSHIRQRTTYSVHFEELYGQNSLYYDSKKSEFTHVSGIFNNTSKGCILKFKINDLQRMRICNALSEILY